MTGAIAIAILAAGSGVRFGGGKLDALAGGRRLGEHALQTASLLGRPMLVVAPDAPQFALDAGLAGQADLLINPLAATGMASSVALAAARAQTCGAGRLLLLLADMPLLRAETLHTLVSKTDDHTPAAVRHPDGRLGIPACFPATWYAQLQDLRGDRGAAALLCAPDAARPVDVPPDELRDIDRPEDLNGVPLP